MKHLFGLSFFLITISSSAFASLKQQDLMAPERNWIKSQKIQFIDQPTVLSTPPKNLNLPFKDGYSNTLIERGDVSVKRSIQMNAAGNAIEPNSFQFDVQLELNYKFS